MIRRRLPWLLSLPLMVAGSLTAHLVGRLMSPAEAPEKAEVHAVVALRLMPLAAAFVMIGLAVAASWVWSRLRHREWRGTSAAWFLILPPVAYAAGEWGELLLHGGGVSIHEARDANIALGLLLQLPFAWLAYLVARALLFVGRALVHAFRRPLPDPRLGDAARPILPRRVAPRRRSLHTVAGSVRGPPPLAA
jgi:hypothetical protein